MAELDGANLSAQKTNRLTVAINNTLSEDTVPQGTIFRPNAKRYFASYKHVSFSIMFSPHPIYFHDMNFA